MALRNYVLQLLNALFQRQNLVIELCLVLGEVDEEFDLSDEGTIFDAFNRHTVQTSHYFVAVNVMKPVECGTVLSLFGIGTPMWQSRHTEVV